MTFLFVLTFAYSSSKAVCLVPSDHVLNLHRDTRSAAHYSDVPQHRLAIAGQFITQDTDDDGQHYYICTRCNHLLHTRKREYLPVISRENKHLLVHYKSAIKDTLGVPYLLNCNILI